MGIPGIHFEKEIKKAENFRVTAYIVGDRFIVSSDVPSAHFETVTDAILIGVSDFNEKGEIVLDENFDAILKNVRCAMGESSANLFVNLIGPGAESEYDSWEDRMEALAVNHEKAFSSGVLENNIKELLDKYGFDGVFFDYEYPLTKEHWKSFSDFLVSLDSVLGDGYLIGYAASPWNAKPSKASLGITDMVEVMSYDNWDKNGKHSPVSRAEKDIRGMLRKGYTPQQLDLGIPFYARPVTQEAYWYGYAEYCDEIDENGLYYDEETGLTFSFNTQADVYEKTVYALKHGIGGVMVWHYSCDCSPENEKSLFNTISRAKTDIIRTYSR